MTQQLSGESDAVAAEDPAQIHRLAVLAVVVAVLVPPLGVVLAVRVLRRTQRESADGRLAIGAILVGLVVLIGEVVLLVASTTGGSPSGTSAAAGAAQEVAASSSAADTSPARRIPDPKGVVTACRVVLPALGQVRTDAAQAPSPDRYGDTLIRLANTVVAGATSTSDSRFLDDVGRLSQAFQKAWQDSSNGTAPSAVADELTAAGAAVRRDCTAAGYHP